MPHEQASGSLSSGRSPDSLVEVDAAPEPVWRTFPERKGAAAVDVKHGCVTDPGSEALSPQTGSLSFLPLVNESGRLSLLKSRYQLWGSGFVVHPDGYIVTCAHVIESASDIQVFVYRGEYVAKVLKVDHEHDLALLKIDPSNPNPVPGIITPYETKLPILPLRSRPAGSGEEIAAFGFGLTNSLATPAFQTESHLTIQGADETTGRFQVSGPLNPCLTGGPIVNRSGEIVGITNAMWTGAAMRPAVALNSSRLCEFLKDAGVSHPDAGAPLTLTRSEVKERTSPIVARVQIRPAEDIVDPKPWAPSCWRHIRSFVGDGSISSAAYSPDGSMIAVAAIPGLSNDSNIRVFDANTGELEHTLVGNLAYAGKLAFSHDNEYLVSLSAVPLSNKGGCVRVWKPKEGRLWYQLDATAADICISADSKLLACCAPRPALGQEARPDVRCYELSSGKQVFSIVMAPIGLEGVTYYVDFLPKLPLLLTSGVCVNKRSDESEVFQLWSSVTGQYVQSLRSPLLASFRDDLGQTDISPDGTMIAVLGTFGQQSTLLRPDFVEGSRAVKIFDVRTMNILQTIPCSLATLPKFLPDNTTLALTSPGYIGDHLELFDARSGSRVWLLPEYRRFAFCEDPSKLLLWGLNSGEAHLFDITTVFES